jgi:hypothetical protein
MINVSDESCGGNQNKFYDPSLFLKNRVVYDIMWKNIVEQGRPQMLYGTHTLHAG